MKLKYIVLVVITLIGHALKTHAQTVIAPKYDIYILMGQSNMAGRGYVTSDVKDEHNDHVFMFTKDMQWVKARHPLHFDKPKAAGVGPGLTFGITMAIQNPDVMIGLVPCAVGGSPIEHWLPGAYDAATQTYPYDDAEKRIKAAMQYGVIKGILWHQGESNSSIQKSKGYLDKLTELIIRVRTLTGNPNLPFVVGELGRYRPDYNNINMQLAQLPKKVKFTAVASSEGLVHRGDTTHFDSPSAQELGRRFAAKMIDLQKQLKK